MASADFAALLVLATAMSFTPGPNTTLSTALAANLGLRRALRFCLAVPVGWALLLLLCSLGLGAAIAASAWLHQGIRGLGLVYLLWLAWQLTRVTRLGEVDPRRLQVGFLQGCALQFLNIKAWMLALSVCAGWVLPGPVGERLLVVLPTMMAFAFASNFSYAMLGALLRGWLAVGRRLQWFNRAMATLLVATAFWMARA